MQASLAFSKIEKLAVSGWCHQDQAHMVQVQELYFIISSNTAITPFQGPDTQKCNECSPFQWSSVFTES